MVKRRCRDLDSTAALRACVGGQNLREKFLLPADDKLLVCLRVIASFFDQLADVRIVQPEFIKPDNLREHLEVSNVIVIKETRSASAVSGETLESFPQFAVARIPANHVLHISLEE